MAVKIIGVQKGSCASRRRIRAGEWLVSVNGHPIQDFLDYNFYTKEEKLILELADEKGKTRLKTIIKDEQEDPGLLFETFLMDKHRRCRNDCVFCFIDQLPPGMRESLYFKDDDARLSFLFGNYITLTNLSQRDVDRIIEMKISPVNISVHTTNPALRVQMMRNKNAGDVLAIIERFGYNNIKMNCQLVLCPGINDGEELRRSISELARLYPAVQSIACVPVGKTRYREGLFKVASYDRHSAAAVVEIITQMGRDFYDSHGTHLCYAADEFYLKAGMAMPGYDEYDGFAQIENGVGMCVSLETEFMQALSQWQGDTPRGGISVATSVAAYPLLQRLTQALQNKTGGPGVSLYQIENRFFGPEITVAGLITGKDLLEQLRGRMLGDRLVISADMLDSEQVRFLDDVTLEEVRLALGVAVLAVPNDGWALLDAMTGEK